MGASVGSTVEHYLNDSKGSGEAFLNYASGNMYEAGKQGYEMFYGDRQNAKKEAENARKEQNQMLADRAAQEKQMKFSSDAAQQRAADRARQRSMSAQSSGRAGTILTGPLGVSGGDSVPRKTLLGS